MANCNYCKLQNNCPGLDDCVHMTTKDALHAAVCKAVALLNCSTEVARIQEGREAHQILRIALADYADDA